jgi:hypothetical protein
MKKTGLIIITVVFSIGLHAQAAFSLCNDLGLQHSFKKGQRYFAVGHTLHGDFNFDKKNAAYAWISYYSEGHFKNRLTATARSPLQTPQTIDYTNAAAMRFKQFSVGWKRYLRGAYDIQSGWSIYGYAGFGLILGRVINKHSVSIDTANYFVPVKSGQGNFSRLTIDVGGGVDWPIGADIFLYSELRAWLPTTDYPSKYLFVNQDAPVVGMLNFGIRILF